jgi:hypothetical protein
VNFAELKWMMKNVSISIINFADAAAAPLILTNIDVAPSDQLPLFICIVFFQSLCSVERKVGEAFVLRSMGNSGVVLHSLSSCEE